MTISDSPSLFSGMARVHRNVIDALSEAGHELLPCGWFAYTNEQLGKFSKGEQPPPLYYESGGRKIRYYCVPKSGGNKPMLTIYDAAEMFKPDVIVTIGDPWDFWYMGPVKSKLNFVFRWVAYVNVESELSVKHAAPLRYADSIISPSHYGINALQKHGLEAEFNPYGVDQCFRRMTPEKRKEIRDQRGIKEGTVRFMTVAQNTTRKNLPALYWAAKELAPLREKFSMHLHTNISATDPQESFAYNLREIEKTMGVTGVFSYPASSSIFESPSDEFLAEEYNASDFLLMPSISEGFALPVLEAMACGLPVIANDTSAMTEHVMDALESGEAEGWHERGHLCSYDLQVFPPAIFARMVRVKSMARGMAEAIENRDSSWMEGKRVSCEEYAKGLTWQGTKERLCEIIGSMGGPAIVPAEEL